MNDWQRHFFGEVVLSKLAFQPPWDMLALISFTVSDQCGVLFFGCQKVFVGMTPQKQSLLSAAATWRRLPSLTVWFYSHGMRRQWCCMNHESSITNSLQHRFQTRSKYITTKTRYQQRVGDQHRADMENRDVSLSQLSLAQTCRIYSIIYLWYMFCPEIHVDHFNDSLSNVHKLIIFFALPFLNITGISE